MATGIRKVGAAAGLPVSAQQVAGLGASGPSMGGGPVSRELVTVGFGGDSRQSNPAAADGICDAVFDTVPTGHMWLVERVNINNTSTVATAAVLYVGAPVPANQVDMSNSGVGDVADEVNPIRVPGGLQLRVRWTGASLGAVGTVSIQYRDAVVADVRR